MMRFRFQKQTIEQRANKAFRKIGFENTTINHNMSTFSDANFPEDLNSIGVDIRTDLNISWVPAETFAQKANYSEGINSLEEPEYCNRSLTECLLIMNRLLPKFFSQFYAPRPVKQNNWYEYTVSVEGVICRLRINSYIPIKDGSILFADVINGSIFPALYEKVIAKVFGTYESIPDDLFQLLQIWTGFVPQIFHPKQHSCEQFFDFFQQSFENGNLVLFKSRNSVKLQSSGFSSGKIFVICKAFRADGIPIAQFLQLNGEKWNGKHSKNSAFWKDKSQLIKKHNLNMGEGWQNYISLKDLISLSRQIMILHNTESYDQNWLICKQTKTKRTFKLVLKGNKISTLIISFHFHGKNCRSSAYVICEETCELLSCSFKQNKSKNFIASNVNPNLNYSLVVHAQDIESKPVAMNISVHSSAGWVDIAETEPNLFLEQKSLASFMENVPSSITYIDENKQNTIKIKSMYQYLGMGFMIIKLSNNFNKTVQISFDQQKLFQNGISILNKQQSVLEFNRSCNTILILKIKRKNKDRQQFPPQGSISVKIIQNSGKRYPLFV